MDSHSIRIDSSKVVYETIDDEVIIINLDTGAYYSVLAVGANIWSFLEKGVSKEWLIEETSRRYEGDGEAVAKAVVSFIDELEREEIIVVEKSEGVEAVNPDGNPCVPFPAPDKLPFSPPSLTKYTNMSDLLLLDPIHDVDEQGWPAEKPT